MTWAARSISSPPGIPSCQHKFTLEELLFHQNINLTQHGDFRCVFERGSDERLNFATTAPGIGWRDDENLFFACFGLRSVTGHKTAGRYYKTKKQNTQIPYENPDLFVSSSNDCNVSIWFISVPREVCCAFVFFVSCKM